MDHKSLVISDWNELSRETNSVTMMGAKLVANDRGREGSGHLLLLHPRASWQIHIRMDELYREITQR